jgi:flagellar hook protein FlgE
MPSFYIPLSGLNADSTALNTIANNLSNMNTTGFKEQTTNFSDLFYQQVGTTGAGGEIQQGTGVQVASNSTDFTGGSISSTGVTTDAAIDGTGFFVLDNGGGQQLYTRDGNFQLSSTGTLESTEGQGVMGYAALNGVINTNGGLTDITIPTGQVMQPSATSNFSMTQNLDSASPVGTQTTGQVKVYDSLGNIYEATVTYTNLGDNKWSYAITLPDTLTAGAATAAAATTMAVNASAPSATAVPTNATVVAPAVTTIPSSVTEGASTTVAATTQLLAANPILGPTLTPAVAHSQVVSVPLGTTTDNYTFAATGLVAPGTTVTITGPTAGGGPPAATSIIVTPTHVDGTVAQYFTDITTALGLSAITPGTVTVTNPGGGPVLTIDQQTATYTGAGTMNQVVPQITTNYNFVSSNGSLATVDPTGTTLNISEGAIVNISAPTFNAGESVTQYAQLLGSTLTTAGITDVTVSGAGGVLSITGPTDMSINGIVKQDFSGTSTSYNFGSYTDPVTGLSVLATVAPSTTLQITAPTVGGGTITVPPNGQVLAFGHNPETMADYAGDLQTALNTAGVTGVTVSGNALTGQLSIVGPSTMAINGGINQNMKGTTNDYNFETNATVDPTTNLKITGETATGTTATIIAPSVAAGETVAQYATALTAALTTASIQNVSVSSIAGQLSIVGANMTINGSVTQDLADTTINYDFGSSATVDTTTALTIVGPTVTGVPPTAITLAPAVVAGETVAQYAADLTKALTAAGIDTSPDGVSVTANGGLLSIVGPANTLKVAGTASQDLSASTISYNFGTIGGAISAVDPTTNLTITGLTAVGATATTVAPAITAGETLVQYVNALTNALTTAGIAGVTVSSTAGGQLSITGANLSTSGSIIQDPVASANASGTLTFNSSGNLVSPAANLNNITFSGLADNAAVMNMSWSLYGANGSGNISQTAATSGQSTQNQNGFASGEYQSFTIGSDGIVSATYSNGQSQNVGQLAIATVSNQQGLVDMGSTQYMATANSGLATVGVAGSGGRGTLEGSSLEASNVNISSEFSNLIVAQRAFEANAKSVTTFDTITQETINMIH